MHYILEEVNLTDTTDEPKPQPDKAETPTSPEVDTDAPETQAQDTTALVPEEPEVVEGEVVELEPKEHPETSTPQKQKPYWLLIPLAIVLCLLYLAVSLLLPLLTPSATVTIIPVERTITTTTVIQVQGRLLLALTLSQSQSAPATGNRHQEATRAQGTITFYNGLLSSQTIAAGTVLTGADGVQIITDQAATIPAANPPIEGHITVSAHAISTGAQGNIPAYDINQACCATSVLAKNTAAFTAGQSARDDIVVSRADITNAVTSLLTTFSQSENAALHVQLHPSEALLPTSCTSLVASDHGAGDEAREVRVTVSETCTGIAYDTHTLYANATQVITTNVQQTLGTAYLPLGNIQVAILHATITNPGRGIATLTVKLAATVVYHITPNEKEQIKNLIAGKTPKIAQALLLHLPAVAGAAITITGNAATLPDNPGKITIVIAERL